MYDPYLAAEAGPTLTQIFMTASMYAGAGAALLSTLASSVFTNKQQQEALITRFGKHIRIETKVLGARSD